MRVLLGLFLAVVCQIASAEIIELGNHRGDFQLWTDFSINGTNNVWASAVADIKPSATAGGAYLDTDAGTVRYRNMAPTAVGRNAVRPFSIPNGLGANKQFVMEMSINETFSPYTQTSDITLPVYGITTGSAMTDGVPFEDFLLAPITLSGLITITGPTESFSMPYSVSGIVPTGSVSGTPGGFPFGRSLRLARDGTGAVVGSAFGRETWVYGGYEADFGDMPLFDITLDGERFSANLSRATFASNIIAGPVGVPEPSGLLPAIIGTCYLFRRKRA